MKKYVEGFRKLMMNNAEYIVKLEICPSVIGLINAENCVSCIDCWREALNEKVILAMTDDEIMRAADAFVKETTACTYALKLTNIAPCRRGAIGVCDDCWYRALETHR